MNLLPVPLIPFQTQSQQFESKNSACKSSVNSANSLGSVDEESSSLEAPTPSNFNRTISPRKVAPLPTRRQSSQSLLLFDEGSNSGDPMTSDDLDFARQDARGNPRFAAGDTVPKPFIAALFGMAYYTPGFLEIIEALLIPSRYFQKSIVHLLMVFNKNLTNSSEHCIF
jgi:hypothetical protein